MQDFRAEAVRGVRPARVPEPTGTHDLPQRAPSESRRRRQGERREGRLVERGAQRRAVSLRVRRRRGHRLRPEGAAQGDALPDERPCADHRRHEPDRDGEGAGARARDASRSASHRGRAARPLPAPRLPARLPQQPARLVEARLHDVLARWLPDLASRRARGGRRVLDVVHVRGHRAHVPDPRQVQARGSRLRHPLPARQRRASRKGRRTSRSSCRSASAGSGSSTRPSSTTGACGSTRSTARSGWWERRSTS